MEDTLRDIIEEAVGIIKDVLILVLMEDTLRAKKTAKYFNLSECLNPCFNGRYSQRDYHRWCAL